MGDGGAVKVEVEDDDGCGAEVEEGGCNEDHTSPWNSLHFRTESMLTVLNRW